VVKKVFAGRPVKGEARFGRQLHCGGIGLADLECIVLREFTLPRDRPFANVLREVE
jgi:hypothetical protein